MAKPIADPADVSDWVQKLKPLVKIALIKENKELKKKLAELQPVELIKKTVGPTTKKYYLRPGPKTDEDMARLANKGVD